MTIMASSPDKGKRQQPQPWTRRHRPRILAGEEEEEQQQQQQQGEATAAAVAGDEGGRRW